MSADIGRVPTHIVFDNYLIWCPAPLPANTQINNQPKNVDAFKRLIKLKEYLQKQFVKRKVVLCGNGNQ